MKARTESATSCTAMADSSRPETRVSSTIPASLMSRVMLTLKRSARYTARWMATMPTAIAT